MPDPEPDRSKYIQDWAALDIHAERRFTDQSPQRSLLERAIKDLNPSHQEEKMARAAQWEHEMATSAPSRHYTGPHLTLPMSPKFCTDLMQHYLNASGGPLHVGYLFQILAAVRDMLRDAPRVNRIKSLSGTHSKLVVVGDLHGQLADLLTIFTENGYPSPHGSQYIFNGDLVDRGEYGIEVTAIIFAYKVLHPTSVHVNRGNHENPDMNVHYGFADEVFRKYNNQYLLQLYQQIFLNLPIATLVDDSILVLHGGLFRWDNVTLAMLETIPRTVCRIESPDPEDALLADILWNDPQHMPGRRPGMRGGQSIFFGPDITLAFLRLNNLDLIVRSHQVPSSNAGFEIIHDDKLVTLFSASNYCNVQGNQGAVMIVEGPGVYYFKEFWAPDVSCLPDVPYNDAGSPLCDPTYFPKFEAPQEPPPDVVEAAQEGARADLLWQIRDMAFEHRKDLVAHWKALSPNDPRVTVRQWAHGMYLATKLTVDFEAHAYSLANVDKDGMVNYYEFLNQFSVNVDDEFAGWQATVRTQMHDVLSRYNLPLPKLLALFDPMRDGVLRPEVLLAEFGHLGLDLGLAQTQVLLAPLAGPKGEVRVVDFLNGLRLPRQQGNVPPDLEEVLVAFGRWLDRSPIPLVEVFQQLDSRRQGQLTFEDFVTAMQQVAKSDPVVKPWWLNGAVLEKVFLILDKDESGMLNYLEFIDAVVPAESTMTKLDDFKVQQVANAVFTYRSALKEAFYELDINGNGVLRQEEFEKGIGILKLVAPGAITELDLQIMASDLFRDRDTVNWYQFLEAFTLRDSSHPNEQGVSGVDYCGLMSPKASSFNRPGSTPNSRKGFFTPPRRIHSNEARHVIQPSPVTLTLPARMTNPREGR